MQRKELARKSQHVSTLPCMERGTFCHLSITETLEITRGPRKVPTVPAAPTELLPMQTSHQQAQKWTWNWLDFFFLIHKPTPLLKLRSDAHHHLKQLCATAPQIEFAMLPPEGRSSCTSPLYWCHDVPRLALRQCKFSPRDSRGTSRLAKKSALGFEMVFTGGSPACNWFISFPTDASRINQQHSCEQGKGKGATVVSSRLRKSGFCNFVSSIL